MNKEIKKKIDLQYWIMPENMFANEIREYSDYVKERKSLGKAASFGYSLAEAEIERLKGLIKTAFWKLPDHRSVSIEWQQFKTDNKL